jgi:formate hydrogenlyase subunit 6/NADH:ubiquinone oxidoreductase subunit I
MTSMMDNPAIGEHLRGICGANSCTALIEYRNVPDRCIRCGKCQEVCPSDAIIGEKEVSYRCCYPPFEIRQHRCTKCGECIKVCPANAIVVVNIEQEAAETAKTGGK